MVRTKTLIGAREISRFTRFPIRTWREWIESLGFPARKIGKQWVSDVDEIQAWYKEQLKKPLS